MKELHVTAVGNQWHIDGYPNAVALKRIDDADARELQALTLHQSDMNFCRAAIDQLERVKASGDVVTIQSLWIASISRFFKCFGKSKSRASLSADEVLQGHIGAMQVFDYFKALRDKNVIHDENAYTQAFTAIALNSERTSSKIADVIAMAINANTCDDSHVVQFKQLLDVATAWVGGRRETLHELLAKRYEQLPYSDLVALPDVQYTAPPSTSARANR